MERIGRPLSIHLRGPTTRQGRLQFGIELKIVAEDGGDCPRDGETSGALMERGPWTIRRYFRKDNQEGIRTYQIHVFEAGSAQIDRHLAFRDYIIAHPVEAQRYSELKRRLAQEHPQSMDGYMDGKDGFIKETDQKAARWRTSQGGKRPAA